MTPGINGLAKQGSKSCNKAELIERIVAKEGCSRKEASEILEMWIHVMQTGLEAHKKILLSGFGTFQISHRKSFVGYDPMNEVEIVVPVRHIPVFKASKVLKNRLNDS